MATQIIIAIQESITLDDFQIQWADKGKNWNSSWLPSTIHYVVWTNQGPNEIQNKDANGIMTGNTPLSSTSDAVGSTTIEDLITWAETRKLQIEEAMISCGADATNDYNTSLEAWLAADSNNTEANHPYFPKTWKDYDPNYS